MRRNVYVCLCVAMLLCTAMFAQAQTADIELPDVTTKIEGADPSVIQEALPRPANTPAVTADLSLPQVDKLTIPEEALASPREEAAGARKDKPVYIEGTIGGGYPGIFIADFSVYQPAAFPEFRLDFSHKSVTGYGNHLPSNGYNDSETAFSGLAGFVFTDKLNLNVKAGYDTFTSGMQNKSQLFYNTTVQNVNVNADFGWMLPLGFEFGARLNGIYLNQYMGFAQTLASDVYTGMGLFTLDPEVGVDWKSDNLSAYFTGTYTMDVLAQPRYQLEHRGELSAGASWTLPLATLSGSVGAVMGTSSGYLFPFELSARMNLPAEFVVEAAGGLSSGKASIPAALRAQPFMPFNYLPREQSDWNASLSVRNSIVTNLTLGASLRYSQTAFGNGQTVSSWEAYGIPADPVSGLFSPVNWERTIVDTTLGAEYRIGIASFAAGWTAHWLDRSRLVSPHEVYFKAGLLGDESRWGADLSLNMGSDIDYMPEISVSGFYSVTDNLRISAELADIVMFFVPKGRPGSSPYIRYGGSGIVKLQLLF